MTINNYKYSIDKLQKMAEHLANEAISPLLLLLNGNLGSGKTTFSQFFIKRLVGNVTVSSPTFNIVQIYESIKGPIWHVDLYRIKYPAELEGLGIFEAIHQHICLIEWPDILEPYIIDHNQVVRISL